MLYRVESCQLISTLHNFTDLISSRGRLNRRPSFPPTFIKDIEIDGKTYEEAAITLDNIDRNILLYAGGMGSDGKGGGPRFKPMDNEIPDSANVQANPGQGADVPQPVRNAGPNSTSNNRQQQLNLGRPILKIPHLL